MSRLVWMALGASIAIAVGVMDGRSPTATRSAAKQQVGKPTAQAAGRSMKARLTRGRRVYASGKGTFYSPRRYRLRVYGNAVPPNGQYTVQIKVGGLTFYKRVTIR